MGFDLIEHKGNFDFGYEDIAVSYLGNVNFLIVRIQMNHTVQ